MDHINQTSRSYSRDILATKLRGTRLKLKKLRIEKGLTEGQLENDNDGLSLLIEENEIFQRLQELNATSSSLSRKSETMVNGISLHDDHAGSIPNAPPANRVNTVTELREVQWNSATSAQHLAFASQHDERVQGQVHSLQPGHLTDSENDFRTTRGGQTTVLPIHSDPCYGSLLFAMPEHMPPLVQAQAQGLDITTVGASAMSPANHTALQPQKFGIEQDNILDVRSNWQPNAWQPHDDLVSNVAAEHTHDDPARTVSGRPLNISTAIQPPSLPESGANMPLLETATSAVSPAVYTSSSQKRYGAQARRQKSRTPLKSEVRPQCRTIMPRTLPGETAARTAFSQTNKIRKQKPRRPFGTQALREETAQTRATGACGRCHKDKERCEKNPLHPQGPCLRCIHARDICIRWKIARASLFRDQTAPWPAWTNRYSHMESAGDIVGWADNQVKVLCLSHRNPATSHIIKAEYAIQVRRFIPEPGDALYQDWLDRSNGQYKRHPIQPYAVTNLDQLTTELNRYVDHSIVPFLTEILDSTDRMIQQTYRVACQRCENKHVPPQERKLLFSVLRLWTTARIASLPEDVRGGDKIADRIDDPSSPYYDTYPVAPVIYAQEETVVLTKIQRPLQKEILAQLDAMMKEAKKETWFTLYLCLFVLAHSCTLTCGRDAEYAAELQLQRKFANPEAINANESGIIGLISLFHRDNKGFMPFDMILNPRGEQEFAESAGLDNSQLQLVRKTAELAKSHDQDFHAIRLSRDPTNPYYFISQLWLKCDPQMAVT